MNKIIVFLFFVLAISCSRQKAYFTEKSYFNYTDIQSLHKKIAVLPVNYVYNQDSKTFLEKNFDRKNPDVILEQVSIGHKLQHTIYEELATKADKLKILSDAETNEVLSKNNINYNDIRRLSKAKLAKILDVDGVIYCDLYVGAKTVNQNYTYGNIPVSTQKKIQLIELIVEIHDNIEESVVWKAKTVIPLSLLYDVNYDTQFKEMIRLDLIPILPYFK